MLDYVEKGIEVLTGEVIGIAIEQGHYVSYSIKFENLVKNIY